MKSITFEQAGMKEEDLEGYISRKPEVLEEGLFIITRQFSGWVDSSNSIDLLALDREGKLVVVELKRTKDAGHAELQAIRYAAMVSNMTRERIVEAHRKYSEEEHSADAEDRIASHLGDNDVDTFRPRIIIASGGFSKEITTSVLWLSNFNELDIRCVRLGLYEVDGNRLLEATQIIPLPEATGYLVNLREREEEDRKEKETRKRAASFKFHMAGVPKGATLVLDERSDEPRKCIAGDPDTADVMYEGRSKPTSLSKLAQDLLGKNHPLQGPIYWKFEGKTLDERRKEREAQGEHGA